MRRALTLAIVTVATLGIALVTADAEAQRRGRGRKIDGVRFDVHLDVGWHEAFGAGLRVELPIVPDGFLSSGSIDDELALSLGGEVFFWSFHDRHYWDGDYRHGNLRYHDGVSFMPLVVAQWNLYFNESWSIFPEAGIATAFWFFDHCHDNPGDRCHDHGYVRFYPVLSFGARWHFTDRNALLMRVSWPVGFQFGITF